jgi:hypothetical protein
VSAVVAMDSATNINRGRQWLLRLHEKGGRQHELPRPLTGRKYLNAYSRVMAVVLTTTKAHALTDSSFM